MLKVHKKYGDVVCEAEKEITVGISEKPQIHSVGINDWKGDNNTLTIIVATPGDYEYSVDGVNFHPGNTFTGLPAGVYTVYVRNSCGTDTDKAVLLTYPRFFTPNNDGKNDTWQVDFATFEPSLSVHIYDRYGKLLTSFRGNDGGWDGSLDGNKLPATDYWFVVERQNGRIFKGHFSLLR